jgi:hypothetical protein
MSARGLTMYRPKPGVLHGARFLWVRVELRDGSMIEGTMPNKLAALTPWKWIRLVVGVDRGRAQKLKTIYAHEMASCQILGVVGVNKH